MRKAGELDGSPYWLNAVIAQRVSVVPGLWKFNVCCFSNRRSLMPFL